MRQTDEEWELIREAKKPSFANPGWLAMVGFPKKAVFVFFPSEI